VHDCQHWWDAAASFELVGFSAEPFSGLCYVPVEFEQSGGMRDLLQFKR